jgi:hypothetical protein
MNHTTKVALGAAMLLALGTSAANAAGCQATALNKPGDTITITATLSTSDPNESGEGEPLLISTLSGQTFADNIYGMAQTYVYKATVANDQIQGINIGSDGDESCSIAATTKSNSWFTPYEKQEAGKVAFDSSLITAVAMLIVEGCTAGVITAPACSLHAGAFMAATAMHDDLYSAT